MNEENNKKLSDFSKQFSQGLENPVAILLAELWGITQAFLYMEKIGSGEIFSKEGILEFIGMFLLYWFGAFLFVSFPYIILSAWLSKYDLSKKVENGIIYFLYFVIYVLFFYWNGGTL